MGKNQAKNGRARDESKSADDAQRRPHDAARACFGKLEGTDPDLAEQARQRVVSKLQRSHES